jgi:transposase
VVRQASNDCAANKFGRWLPDCSHSADDFIREQRKNAMVDTAQANTGGLFEFARHSRPRSHRLILSNCGRRTPKKQIAVLNEQIKELTALGQKMAEKVSSRSREASARLSRKAS